MNREQFNALIDSGAVRKLEKLACNVAGRPRYFLLSHRGDYFSLELFDSEGDYSVPAAYYPSHEAAYLGFDNFVNQYNREFVRILEKGHFSPSDRISTQVLNAIVVI
jgi:hypothetical protein